MTEKCLIKYGYSKICCINKSMHTHSHTHTHTHAHTIYIHIYIYVHVGG